MRAGDVSKRGFTLVEVIVATGIFAMVIAGGVTGVRMGFEIVGNSRHYTRVSQILQSEVESLRSLSWKELNQLPANADVDINPQFDTTAYNSYEVSRRMYNVSSGLRRIEVVVSFNKRNGQKVALKYLTFFTEGGVNDYYYRTI